MSNSPKQSLRALLTEIVDYAGLFPPSKLTMAAAAQNYADYLKSEHAWMLGRFVVNANRLEELAERAQSLWTTQNDRPWRISALANESLAETIDQIESFNYAHEGRAKVDALELKVTTVKEIEAAKKMLPEGLTAYLEVPFTIYMSELISAIVLNRVRAKVRAGGVTQEAFPPVDELVKFSRVCIAANLPFKATAGLHHPLRSTRALTYEENSVVGTMHGFLNLFLSAAFLRQNLNNTFVHKLMVETEIENFEFDDTGVTWQGHRVELRELELMRKRNVVSFGSCSFVEPIEDLQKLGLL